MSSCATSWQTTQKTSAFGKPGRIAIAHAKEAPSAWLNGLNPIIRNAVCTALDTFDHYTNEVPAKRFMDYHLRMIPEYWEPAELQPGDVSMWDEGRFGAWEPG